MKKIWIGGAVIVVVTVGVFVLTTKNSRVGPTGGCCNAMPFPPKPLVEPDVRFFRIRLSCVLLV
jgi:hypothetical protein